MPTLLFDLDDTLLITHDAHHAAMDLCAARLRQAHPEIDAGGLKKLAHELHLRIEDDMEHGRSVFKDHREFRTRVWTETLRSLSLPDHRASEFAELYREERTRRYQLFDDVEEVISDLGKRYDLVLVTNGMSDLQRDKIDAMRLERWFPHLLVSGEVGSWKPHPDIFHAALRCTGASPDDAAMIGDSLSRDISGARGVGIRTIWLKRYAHQRPDPAHPFDALAETLHDVARQADRWFGSGR